MSFCVSLVVFPSTSTSNIFDSHDFFISYTKIRAACNVPHRRPQDIFRDLYGYACGDNGDNYECGSKGWGECRYGTKKEQFLLDTYLDVANYDVEKIKTFNYWLRATMVQAAMFYSYCPSLQVSCVDHATDPVAEAERTNMELAFREVNYNLDRAVACIQNEPTQGLTMEFLLQQVNHGECEDVPIDGGQQNGCIAGQIRDTLEENDPFELYEWLVVVYSSDDCVSIEGDELSRTNSNAGYKRIVGSDRDGLMNKKFHFMYHKKGFDASKTTANARHCLFMEDEDDWILCHMYPECSGVSSFACIYNIPDLDKGFGYIKFQNCDGNNRGAEKTKDFIGNIYFDGGHDIIPNIRLEGDWIY